MLALFRKLFNQNYKKINTVIESENLKIELERRQKENNNLQNKMEGISKSRNILYRRFPVD